MFPKPYFVSTRDLKEKPWRNRSIPARYCPYPEAIGNPVRYMQVCITQAGRDCLLSFFPEHVRGIVEEMSVLTAAEQEELARLCRKLGLRES